MTESIYSSPVPSPRVAEGGGAPRLSPVDRYAGIWIALMRAACRATFGKVMMPLRVILPRIPRYGFAHVCMMWFAQWGLRLSPTIKHVLSMRVSRNNSCSFCFDIHKASFMLLEKPDLATLELAARDASDPTLDPQLRALLAYADEVVHQGNVSDATFAALLDRFSEKEVVEIVWLAAFVMYTNMLARPLRLPSDGFCAIVNTRSTVQAAKA